MRPSESLRAKSGQRHQHEQQQDDPAPAHRFHRIDLVYVSHMAPALDVAFGLVFLYLSLALTATAVNEWIAAALKLRARTLREGIAHLLDGTAGPAAPLSKEFYAHPLIAALSQRGRPPSYIPPATFSSLLKILSRSSATTGFRGVLHARGRRASS